MLVPFEIFRGKVGLRARPFQQLESLGLAYLPYWWSLSTGDMYVAILSFFFQESSSMRCLSHDFITLITIDHFAAACWIITTMLSATYPVSSVDYSFAAIALDVYVCCHYVRYGYLCSWLFSLWLTVAWLIVTFPFFIFAWCAQGNCCWRKASWRWTNSS